MVVIREIREEIAAAICRSRMSPFGGYNFDRRHMLKTVLVYELPVVKRGNIVLRKALSGWIFSGIFQALSGLPVGVSQGRTRHSALVRFFPLLHTVFPWSRWVASRQE